MTVFSIIPAPVAARIRLLILDVDGVLTDGRLHFNRDGEAIKSFHAHDGQGLLYLQQAGIKLAIISRGQSDIVAQRARYLGINEVYQGCMDKRSTMQRVIETHQLSLAEVACMGDDLPDLEMIQAAGCGIAVANAVPALKQVADIVTQKSGGYGAVREICDQILAHQIEPNHIIQ